MDGLSESISLLSLVFHENKLAFELLGGLHVACLPRLLGPIVIILR
jgi:hypothetical protein